MLPVVGHVHDLRETLRVRAATANVAHEIHTCLYNNDNNMTCKAL